ncbi:pilus assembly protein PilO [Planococcus alpniumensis]|uniref:pilus assembly protein PilO n=1 Tax=Planococcus alpniumensis TaxID=2708345 RepID=UPI001B8BC30F|nr:pilus assembly protein PilO [Planococcus sp. MSAK28401]
MSSLSKTQKEKGLIGLAVILLLAIAAYSYFFLYAPAKEAKLQAEQILSSERDVLVTLQTQLRELPEGERVSIRELQKKVSVEALTEMIVLQVEQAELLSNTLINNIGITEGVVELPVAVEGLENLQEVLTTVTINANEYQDITTFIDEVESMERILIVEAIDFDSTEEVIAIDQEIDPIEATLTFSAYFRPDLIELADSLPKLDAPAPAGKVNPLPQNDGTDFAVEFETAEDEGVDSDSENEDEENAAVTEQ